MANRHSVRIRDFRIGQVDIISIVHSLMLYNCRSEIVVRERNHCDANDARADDVTNDIFVKRLLCSV